jgi:hypothetical protein
MSSTARAPDLQLEKVTASQSSECLERYSQVTTFATSGIRTKLETCPTSDTWTIALSSIAVFRKGNQENVQAHNLVTPGGHLPQKSAALPQASLSDGDLSILLYAEDHTIARRLTFLKSQARV